MIYPARLQALIDALRALPGVGRKSAQRMAFQLLEHDRQAARTLAQSLEAALESLRRCVDCRMFSDADRCPICRSQRRDRSVMCVVESPADLVAVEQGAEYSGLYFVLHGRLSPLDGGRRRSGCRGWPSDCRGQPAGSNHRHRLHRRG